MGGCKKQIPFSEIKLYYNNLFVQLLMETKEAESTEIRVNKSGNKMPMNC